MYVQRKYVGVLSLRTLNQKYVRTRVKLETITYPTYVESIRIFEFVRMDVPYLRMEQ